MKAIVWIVVAIVVIAGLVWFFAGSTDTDSVSDSDSYVDPLTPEGRNLDSDDEVFSEIDESLDALE